MQGSRRWAANEPIVGRGARQRRWLIALVVALAAAVTTSAARGTSLHAAGVPPTPFTVTLTSQPIYDIAPQTHKQTLVAPDGTKLFLETWLPATKDGNVPRAKLPTILVITPYQQLGTLESASTMRAMVPRGYAYSQLHVRGTGLSGGCISLYGPSEARDGAQAVEWVATKSPWGNGIVGGYGVSYPGGTILNTAARGNPAQTQYLKAVLAGAPAVGLYESAWTFDGVPSFAIPQTYIGQYLTLTSLPLGETGGDPAALMQQYLQKPACYPSHLVAAVDLSGNFTPYYQAREARDFVQNIHAAVFTFSGHADVVPLHGVPPIVQTGLFDRLPASTPKFGIFGEFGHENPSSTGTGVAVNMRRGDFMAMEIAWFDHFLKGVPGNVDQWGTAQVQGTDGAWRKVDDWPRGGGGPTEQLLLAPGRLTGSAAATGGSTSYLEGSFETTSGFLPGTAAVFDTGPLTTSLELTGQPLLDLWLQLTLPDSHVAARLDAFDATGARIPQGTTYALRSARHRDPFVDGRFEQHHGDDAPTGVPFALELRFQPTDIVVPIGGHLRLTIAGSVIVNPGLSQLGVPESIFLGPSQPSGMIQSVVVLHDPAHPSALRFETPDPDAVAIAPVPLGG